MDVTERMTQLLEAKKDLDRAGAHWRELVADTTVELEIATGATVPIPGYGSATVIRPEPEYHVEDAEALHGWIAVRYPEHLEIIIRVRPALFDGLATQGAILSEDGATGVLIDPSGEAVPGVRVYLPRPTLAFAEGPVEGEGEGEPEEPEKDETAPAAAEAE